MSLLVTAGLLEEVRGLVRLAGGDCTLLSAWQALRARLTAGRVAFTEAEDFFAHCARDEAGHCKSGDGGGEAEEEETDEDEPEEDGPDPEEVAQAWADYDDEHAAWQEETAELKAEHEQEHAAWQKETAELKAEHEQATAAWSQRDDERTTRREQAEADHVYEAESAAQRWPGDAPEATDSASVPEYDQDDVESHAADAVEGWAEAFGKDGHLQKSLEGAGATAAERAKVQAVADRGQKAIEKAAQKYQKAATVHLEVVDEWQAHKRSMPPEPVEPDAPDEPDDPGADATDQERQQYEQDRAAYEAASAQYDEQMAQYEKDTAQWEKADAKLEEFHEQVDDLAEKANDAASDLSDTLDEHKGKVAEAVEKVQERLGNDLDAEAEADPEPDEPDYPDEPEEPEYDDPPDEPEWERPQKKEVKEARTLAEADPAPDLSAMVAAVKDSLAGYAEAIGEAPPSLHDDEIARWLGRFLARADVGEAIIPNKTGPGCHDDETGHPAPCPGEDNHLDRLTQHLTASTPTKVPGETLEYDVWRAGNYAVKKSKHDPGSAPAYVMRAQRLSGLVPPTYLVHDPEGEKNPLIVQKWVQGREATQQEVDDLAKAIHDRGVIPRDLTTRNVVVDDSGHAWAFDVGNFEVDFEHPAAKQFKPDLRAVRLTHSQIGAISKVAEAGSKTEGCIPNKIGKGHHDDRTGAPCNPDAVKDDRSLGQKVADTIKGAPAAAVGAVAGAAKSAAAVPGQVAGVWRDQYVAAAGGKAARIIRATAGTVTAGVRAFLGGLKQKAVDQYGGWEEQFGRKGAIAIAAASVALLPVPAPGTMYVPLIAAKAFSFVVNHLKGRGEEPEPRA